MTRLYKHQVDFIKENPDKSCLVWSCGTGKSRTACEWSKKDNLKVLVICPKSLKLNWKREALKWEASIVVISKEEFRRDYESLPIYNQIIVDEVHNGFLTPFFKSKMSKALRNYIKLYKVPRILLLSATVYTSSPWNIYNLAYLLGHKWNWQEFNYKFFNQVRMGMRIIPVPKRGVEKDLAILTKKIASVVNIYDVIDVPLQQHCEPEYFELTKEQKSAIKEAYDPLPIVRYTMQHEIENGVLLGNEFRLPKVFDCDKNQRILSIVEENKKVAIVCRYNEQINVLARLLAHYTPLIIRGDVKDRDSVTIEAENSEKCVVLIQADCAEGYELPSFPVCIFASMSYSYAKWEQISGRFLRINKPSRTTFIYLLIEGDSLDQSIYDSIKRKEDFKIELHETRSKF